MRFRLLPAVLFFATGLLFVKTASLVLGILDPVTSISQAVAADSPPKVTDAAGRLRQQELNKHEAMGRKKGKKSDKSSGRIPDGRDLTERQNPNMPTRAELALLKRLAARRDTLAAREKNMLLRENLLRAAEKKVEAKIRKLQAMEKRIASMKKQRDIEKEERFQTLVSLYEKMKPKKAARIFDKLDIGLLADVAKKMKSQKMAAVMSSMNVTIAERLTMELARREKETGDQPVAGELPKIGD